MVRGGGAVSVAVWAVVLAAELLALYGPGARLSERLAFLALDGRPGARLAARCALAPGVALHEASHALASLLVGGRVERFVAFRPQRTPDGGALLGYVQHRLPAGTAGLAGAWTGMAPLWMVPLVVWAAARLVVPGAEHASPLECVRLAVSGLPSVWCAAWLALLASASLGLLPSRSDHRELPLAFATVLAAVGLAGLVAGWDALPVGALESALRWLSTLLAAPAVLCGCAWVLRAARSGTLRR